MCFNKIEPGITTISSEELLPICIEHKTKFRAWFESHEYAGSKIFSYNNEKIERLFLLESDSLERVRSVLFLVPDYERVFQLIHNKYGSPHNAYGVSFDINSGSFNDNYDPGLTYVWDLKECYITVMKHNEANKAIIRIAELSLREELATKVDD